MNWKEAYNKYAIKGASRANQRRAACYDKKHYGTYWIVKLIFFRAGFLLGKHEARTRVCEWGYDEREFIYSWKTECGDEMDMFAVPNYCPNCGGKIKVVEG